MEELADESINIVVTSPPYPMVEMWDDIFAMHNRFVADREINGKDLKYFNKHLGCKVMTKQEQDIKL